MFDLLSGGLLGSIFGGLFRLAPEVLKFFLEHPRALVERPSEDAVIDRANAEIVAAHLPCAAAEPRLHGSASTRGTTSEICPGSTPPPPTSRS